MQAPLVALPEPAGGARTSLQVCYMFFNIKWIHTPHTRAVAFWHISNMPPRIWYSQICYNTPILYIVAIFLTYCYTTSSWLFCLKKANIRCLGCSPLGEKIRTVKQDYWNEYQGSDQFISFNSIQFQFKLDSGFFNSIQFQFKSDSVSFNSIPIPIHFLSIPIQFNSNVMHRNKQINQIIGYFKFNLNISLFAAQFRKYIIQDHNNSRINKSALVQVLG